MVEFHINDQWILDRVSNQSSSFKNWITNLIQTVQKSVQESHPEVAEKLKNKQDIPDLMALDEKMRLAEQKVNQVTKSLGEFSALGGFMSDLMSNIQNQVMQSIQAKMPSSFPHFDINLDFLTGKQKNLAKTLYDVAKERGIKSEGILYLIKSLPDLESFLYSTSAGKYYRDHTEHQLRVAVLGDFLLEQDLGQGSLLSHIADLSELDKNLIKEKIWWFMGLVHDIGYPLQKMALSINYSLLNQILKSYPMLDFDVVPFEIFLPSKNINPYLPFLEEGLSKQARLLIRNGLGLNFTSLPKPKTKYFLTSDGGHKEYVYESEIKLDHGAIGALNVLKSLGSPEDIKAHYDEFIGYIKAAQAIALHNFKEQLSDYIFDNNPLAFLLVLLDEMQEIELIDGGNTNWMQKLLNNAKERLIISGIGSERLCEIYHSDH